MNNERAKSVDVVFSSGVRQDVEPRTAPPGTLVNCDNLEFDQLNRLVRRDGFATLGTSRLSKSNVIDFPVRRAVQTPKGERLLFTDTNTFVHVPAVDKMSEAGLDAQFSTQRATLEATNGIAADETGAILSCDCAAVAGYIVYAYMYNDPTPNLFSVFVDVVDAATNARVVTHMNVGVGDATIQPRVVVSGGASVIFVVWKDAGNLKYSRINLAAATIAPTAGANLLTDILNVGGVFDVDTMTSGWVIVYTQSTGPRAQVRTFDSTPANTNSYTWLANAGAVNWTPSVLGVHGNVRSGDVRTAGYDPALFNMESKVLTSALASSATSRFDPGLSHTKPATQLTLTARNGTTSLVLFSNYTSNTVTTNPRGHLYCYHMPANAVMAAQVVFAHYSLASKAFRDTRNDLLYAFGRFDDPSGFQNHLMLLDFSNINAGPRPALHVASGRVPLKADNAVTGIGGVADLTAVAAGRFQIAFPVNIGASQISGNQVIAYTFQSLGRQRFLSTPCQGEAVIGGGTPLAYDGQRLVELSFYSYPILKAGNVSTATVGGFMPQGTYQYCAVYEWTDALGNRHQSPPSPAITVDMSAGGFVAGTNMVLVTFPAYHPTRKQVPATISGTADTSSPIRVVVYRTLSNRATPFYRMAIAAVNNTTSAADDTVIADSYSDADIGVNEPLYAGAGGRGELATTAPPPTIFVTTHAQRLWGIDGENPERIWCTKVLQDLVSPGYNQALQVTIPGAGRINGVAGQDGKLYALATNGIYLASYGDGPDNTGGGAFPSPQLITTEATCEEPRSVLVASTGIYFTGRDKWGTGIYLIRRGDGQPIAIGKRVRDELTIAPECRGAIDRIDKSRVEFLFGATGDSQPSVLLYYHYDLLDAEGIGQWTVARPTSAAASTMESLGLWTNGSTFVSVLSDTSSVVGVQTPGTVRDFGNAYPVVRLTTTDLRPFGLVGYGQISGMTLFGTCLTRDPLKIEASYDSGLSWPDTLTWDVGTDAANAPTLRRWEAPTQKLPDGGTVRLRVSDATVGADPPGTTYFHGLTLELAQLGGNARLANERRG